MANIKIVKRRIKSAQNISQITRAMEMVAASKMKKAQETAILGKPYAEKIYQVVSEFASRIDKKAHPLLSDGYSSGKILIIMISTNKGLCGGLNTNLFRAINNWWNQNDNLEFVTLGKKGSSFVTRTGKNLTADFSLERKFTESVSAVTKIMVDGFINHTYKEVYLVYNVFINALKQIPVKKRILPIRLAEENLISKETESSEFLIEPGIDEILEDLLPHYLENQLRTAIFESEASEHSARMIAMKNATDAANDLTFELTLVYNKARQEKITNEIADIVTARMAVE
ncbi:ATP synthase F1 subunit gamma [Candidatus Microgenomates bacterium]|nr:ATP synthase F1 subunit gamma [Candidatus Microgenomates bacterium]